jgi:hypothetical protein
MVYNAVKHLSYITASGLGDILSNYLPHLKKVTLFRLLAGTVAMKETFFLTVVFAKKLTFFLLGIVFSYCLYS